MLDELTTALGPGIELPGLFGVQVVHPVWFGVVWLGLLGSMFVLDRIVSRVLFDIAYYTGVDPFGLNHASDDEPNPDLTEEPSITVEELETRLEQERNQRRGDVRWALKVIVLYPLVEESVFRGLPLLLALTMGGEGVLLWLLLGGNALWAALHTRDRPPASMVKITVFAGGLVLVYLWLIGLWWVAVLAHVGHTLTLLSICHLLPSWDERGRPFRPGDEYTVTISPPDELSMTYGSFGGYTPDRRRLYVPGLKPGETARVRVATTEGRVGFGVPIDDPVSSVE